VSFVGSNEQGHRVPLLLNKRELLAFNRFMADKGFGKSFAGKRLLISGLFHEGYLDKEVYEKLSKFYDEHSLAKELELEEEKPQTIKQVVKEEAITRYRKTLIMVSEQWDRLSAKAKDYHIKKAIELKDFPEAKEILRKAGVSK